ncbi:hypothetical protein D3874_18190 [Oleomonas cavernae]|uniref:Uncharacterized protein n=1 Tax=Oleomonas cavernae TaxID=2320859 RepID=A0A418WFI1_9PROT|nr:hypothetical protein [Oleomonas cavernae]RJF88679.1 hypothetical protein D3874_18190 [Oleomonas cavernae]
MSDPTDQTVTPPMQLQYVATDGGAYVIAFPAPKADVPVAEVVPVEVVAVEVTAVLAAAAD